MTRVFVCRDYRLAALLDGIAETLTAEGVDVVRGPHCEAGEKPGYPADQWPYWFDGVTAAVFSNLNPCPRRLLEYCTSLCGVVMPTIGTEAIDVDAATELGIVVAHGACEENVVSMAEATLMLVLMLLYRPTWTMEVMAGQRARPSLDHEQLWAQMLMRKTVGLVGFGRIARAVAARLQGWQVDVVACAPSLDMNGNDPWPGVRAASLDQTLAASDVVCVLAAGGESSRKIIGERELRLMKPGAFLVNTARGSLVDEAALYRALAAGALAGAALDVFEVEPLAIDSPLRSLSNVLLTPHMIGHTRELSQALSLTALGNLRRVLAGAPPLHCRNPQVLPRRRQRSAIHQG